MERFAAEDWDHLLAALFERLQAPIALDDLVSVTVALLKVQEDRTDSLDAMLDDETTPDLPDPTALSPQQAAEVRSMLRRLWGAVLVLKPDYRTAYLLNLPGVAQLDLDSAARAALERCSADVHRFEILWDHLPLMDALIGALLRLDAQQVINRRMLALRELARLMAHTSNRLKAP